MGNAGGIQNKTEGSHAPAGSLYSPKLIRFIG